MKGTQVEYVSVIWAQNKVGFVFLEEVQRNTMWKLRCKRKEKKRRKAMFRTWSEF